MIYVLSAIILLQTGALVWSHTDLRRHILETRRELAEMILGRARQDGPPAAALKAVKTKATTEGTLRRPALRL